MGRTSTGRTGYRPTTFNGLHNLLKARVLMVLYYLWEEEGYKARLTATQIAYRAGMRKENITAYMGKWTRYKYVNRSLGVSQLGGKPCYLFKITLVGKKWLDKRVPEDIKAAIIESILEVREKNRQQESEQNVY